MRPLALIFLALTAGCRPDRIGGSAGDLSLETPRLHFPRTVVGYPTEATLEIRNGSKSTRAVKLETQAPFAVLTATFDIPGGASVRAQLRFDPQAPGQIERALKVQSEDQRLEAVLIGPAQLPPACAQRGPCWHLTYDHAAGGCVRVNAPDAAACVGGTACLLTSQCLAGVCVGTARDCSDGDACTTDACDVDTGCVHFSATARCGASTDPCLAPACDPAIGCTFTEVQDGTSCGASDCEAANICLLGSCKRVAVGDGAACGSDSPCQPPGLCAGKACVRQPPSELTAAWTAWAPADRRVLWDSIADRDNNVYWREVEASGAAHLVSVTAAGFKRFDVAIPVGVEQVALVEDVLILRHGASVEARSVGNGQLKWTKTITDATAGVISVRTLSRGTAATLYIGLRRMSKAPMPTLLGSAVQALNLSTGALKWEILLPEQQLDDQSTPVDEAGYLYAGTAGLDGKHRYYGFTPQGQVRWRIENPHSSPAAVFGGRVYHWDHWLSETSSGAWVNSAPPTLFGAGYPRLGLGAISFVGRETAPVPECSDGGTQMGTALQLVRVDPATSLVQWTTQIAGADAGGLEITNTVLTSRSTVLFSQPEDYCNTTGRTALREVSAQGSQSFSCRLPGFEAYFGEGLLNGPRWVAAVRAPNGRDGVRAIDLPGFQLPAHGWSTAWGSPARDNHAR